MDVPYIGAVETIKERIRQIGAESAVQGSDDWLRIIGIKTFLDGGMLTGSAYMREPWGVSEIYAITDPDYRGVLFIPKERLREWFARPPRTGCNSPRTPSATARCTRCSKCMTSSAARCRSRDTRPCITHSNFMSTEAVERRAAWRGARHPARLALPRHAHAREAVRLRAPALISSRSKSLSRPGVIAGGGSDHMQKIGSLRSINPYNPFLGMRTAITRRARWYDGALHPEEASRASRRSAFTPSTTPPAFPGERKPARSKPGKFADLVVLDRDLLTCPVDEIVSTRVLQTYVGGKLVYETK